MIKISTSRIRDIVEEIDGKEVNGIQYDLNGDPKGIAAVFTTNADDEEAAMVALKKYLKEKLPAFMLYTELV